MDLSIPLKILRNQSGQWTAFIPLIAQAASSLMSSGSKGGGGQSAAPTYPSEPLVPTQMMPIQLPNGTIQEQPQTLRQKMLINSYANDNSTVF